MQERQKLSPEQVDDLLRSHDIDPVRLRADDLTGMMVARAEALAVEIADATGRPVGGMSFADIFGNKQTPDDDSEDLAA